MARAVPKNPLIFVLGATGTGKSQVGLEADIKNDG
jgi:tRNA A37 N6-isopentenylltransferase MiaA